MEDYSVTVAVCVCVEEGCVLQLYLSVLCLLYTSVAESYVYLCVNQCAISSHAFVDLIMPMRRFVVSLVLTTFLGGRYLWQC